LFAYVGASGLILVSLSMLCFGFVQSHLRLLATEQAIHTRVLLTNVCRMALVGHGEIGDRILDVGGASSTWQVHVQGRQCHVVLIKGGHRYWVQV
jgi:hypothetical protein